MHSKALMKADSATPSTSQLNINLLTHLFERRRCVSVRCSETTPEDEGSFEHRDPHPDRGSLSCGIRSRRGLRALGLGESFRAGSRGPIPAGRRFHPSHAPHTRPPPTLVKKRIFRGFTGASPPGTVTRMGRPCRIRRPPGRDIEECRTFSGSVQEGYRGRVRHGQEKQNRRAEAPEGGQEG